MDSFTIYTGSEGQILSDQIIKEGRPIDLTDASSVKFLMRPATDSTIVVEETATIDNVNSGLVSFAWDDSQLEERGEYFGWWRIVYPDSSNIDTPEFLIIITEHAPGLRTRTGAFYAHAKSQMPVSWRHLEEEVGDAVLQTKIEVIKKKLFTNTILVEDEEDQDIRVQSYVGKLAAISSIPMAVDYWMNQKQSVSATGTNENVSYPNRVEALWKLYERLLAEVAKDKDEIEAIIGTPTIVPLTAVPGVSLGSDDNFATPLPQKYFQPYAFPKRNSQPW